MNVLPGIRGRPLIVVCVVVVIVVVVVVVVVAVVVVAVEGAPSHPTPVYRAYNSSPVAKC